MGTSTLHLLLKGADLMRIVKDAWIRLFVCKDLFWWINVNQCEDGKVCKFDLTLFSWDWTQILDFLCPKHQLQVEFKPPNTSRKTHAKPPPFRKETFLAANIFPPYRLLRIQPKLPFWRLHPEDNEICHPRETCIKQKHIPCSASETWTSKYWGQSQVKWSTLIMPVIAWFKFRLSFENAFF